MVVSEGVVLLKDLVLPCEKLKPSRPRTPPPAKPNLPASPPATAPPPAIPPKGGKGDPPEFANQFLPRNDQLMLLFSKKLLLLVWYGTDVVTICP